MCIHYIFSFRRTFWSLRFYLDFFISCALERSDLKFEMGVAHPPHEPWLECSKKSEIIHFLSCHQENQDMQKLHSILV